MTSSAGGADRSISNLMSQLHRADQELSSGSVLSRELSSRIHQSAEAIKEHSDRSSKDPKLQDRASALNHALDLLDYGIQTPDAQAQKTAVKCAKAFLVYNNLGKDTSVSANQLFSGPVGIDEVDQYIQSPTSHPHWIRFQENMNRSFPRMKEEQVQEIFRKVLCGIAWNLLKTMPLEELTRWNPPKATPEALKIRDSLIGWQKELRQEYKETLDILKSLQVSDQALQKEIDAFESDPANIDEASKKAQAFVDKMRGIPMEWEKIPTDKQAKLNQFSPGLPVAKGGLSKSADIYSAVQQHTMAVRSGRGGNPYFEFALQEIRKHDKDACQSLETKFRKAPVSLWGGGIQISDQAHESGYQVLEHSKLGAAFNGVQLHPSYPTYEPLWERLSQEFVRYHVEAQRHAHPDRAPQLTLHTRTLNQHNIGQMIELPTALGVSKTGDLPKLTLYVYPMATDESGKPIRLMPLNVSINLHSKQESTEVLEPLYEVFLGFYQDYEALSAVLESGKANPNLPPPQDYETKRVFVNANLWAMQEARKIEAERRGDTRPLPNLRPLEPWPLIGSSRRHELNPNRKRFF